MECYAGEHACGGPGGCWRVLEPGAGAPLPLLHAHTLPTSPPPRLPPPPPHNPPPANLAAFLTVTQLQASVRSVNELQGRAVGSSAAYASRLARHNIISVIYEEDDVLVSVVR